MKNTNELAEALRSGNRVRISSRFTSVGVGGMLLTVVILLPVMLTTISTSASVMAFSVSLVLMAALTIAVILQFVHAANAYLIGSELLLKRLFGTHEVITLDQITDLREFRLKNTKYTLVKYNSREGFKTRLILNDRSLLFGTELSAKEVLNYAKGHLAEVA